MVIILIKIMLCILAAIFVMIVHELTKALVYKIYTSIEKSSYMPYSYFKIWKYIDPIGLILAIVQCGIFSKQYPFVIKSRVAAIGIGVSGFISMLFLALISTASFEIFVVEQSNELVLGAIQNMPYIAFFLQMIAIYSCTLFLVNLFPLSSFDISLILAGTTKKVFFVIKKYDAVLKLLFMIFLILQIFPYGGFSLFSLLCNLYEFLHNLT